MHLYVTHRKIRVWDWPHYVIDDGLFSGAKIAPFRWNNDAFSTSNYNNDVKVYYTSCYA